MHVAEVMSFINEGKKEVISEIKMVEEYEDISSSSSEGIFFFIFTLFIIIFIFIYLYC